LEMQLVATDYCNNNPVTLKGDSTLYDARNILIKYKISRVVILNDKEHNRPAGIVKEKDIVRFLHAEFSRKGLDEIRLHEDNNKPTSNNCRRRYERKYLRQVDVR
jgi:CBS domain-containing protein